MFCFQSMYDNMYTPALGFQLDKLDAVLDHAGNPVGIACYLPDNSQGEDNVQDFLGMVGLPVVCTPYFPEDADRILLTRASACDPDIVEKLDRWLLEKDGTAMVTTGFIEATQDRGVSRFTSVRLRGRKVSARRYRVEEEERRDAVRRRLCLYPTGDRPITIPVAEFRNNATWAVVKAVHGEESYGILLRDYYGKGCLYTLAVPDAFPDIYHIPAEALGRIRQAMAVNGVWMEAPAGVSLFMYDNDALIVYPYVMSTAEHRVVRLRVKGAKALSLPVPKVLSLPTRGRRVEPLYVDGDEAVFELAAKSGEYVIYKIER